MMRCAPSARAIYSRAFACLWSVVLMGCDRPASVVGNVPSKIEREQKAREDCLMLARAMNSFHAEYFGYPVQGAGDGPHQLSGASTIAEILLAGDTEVSKRINRRGIRYIEFSQLAEAEDLPGYHADSGRFNDPWGRPYRIYVDEDGDGRLAIPPEYGSLERVPETRGGRSVFVHSAGPDGVFSTVEDNITSRD